MANVKSGVRRNSKHFVDWVKNTFNAWRKVRKHDTFASIDDMSEKDPKELVELVWIFMLEMSKSNGDLYPPLSIRNLA